MNRLIFLVFFLALIACKKEPYDNMGIIVDELNWNETCLNPISGVEYIITSDSAMNALANQPPCSGVTPPVIDFNAYSLLGKVTTVDCRGDIYRQVLNDESNKEYIYKIYINEKGHCQDEIVEINFVLVPKLPNDYTVAFQVEYH